MTSSTREEFLSYVHTPLTHSRRDPAPVSPTISRMRYRWRELRHWDVEADAKVYWEGLPTDDKQARLPTVTAGHWEDMHTSLSSSNEPYISEETLQRLFDSAFTVGHNLAIRGSSDAHAEICIENSDMNELGVVNSDLMFVYDHKLTGIIELKTWWNLTQTEIEEVKVGIYYHIDYIELMIRPRTVGGTSPRTLCCRANLWLHGTRRDHIRDHIYIQCICIYEATKSRHSLYVSHDSQQFHNTHNDEAPLFLL